MSPFEYLSVLISVIVGLGISHLLTGVARLIQLRRRLRLYPPTLLWMATLFILQIQIWWVAYMSRGDAGWTFFSFVVFLVVPIIGYLLCYLVIPDLESGGVDLRANYHANRAWFFGLIAAAIVVSLARNAARGTLALDPDSAFLLAFLLLAVAGAGIRREWFHIVNALLSFTLFCAYVFVRFLSLR
ncbi:MAG TPA: hypothetical protein VFQ38_07465 [Longimicrobiales bacterium]|nr:hypothetical protein [Longimicrobiales bacterium]